MRKLLFVTLAFLGILLLACGEVKVAGGVSEETNTIAGVLENPNGDRLANVAVFARRVFVDSVIHVDTTTAKGHFSFELENGEYAISAKQKDLAYYEVVAAEKDMDIKAVALPLDTFDFVVKYSDGSLAKDAVVSVPGSEISTVADTNGKLRIALPHADVLIYVRSGSKNFEDAYFKVVDGKVAGPYATPKSLLELLERDDKALESDTLVLPKKTSEFATWNMSTVQDGKVLSNGKTLYVYGSPLVKNDEMHFTSASEFAVLESDDGAFDGAESFSATLKLNIVEMPSDSTYRKNILGKVGFGTANDESAFSIALIKGECGVQRPMLAVFVADSNSDFAVDCGNVALANVNANEDMLIAVSFDKGNLNIYKNGMVIGRAKTGVSKLRNSKESIYLGKETISMKVSSVSLSLDGLNESEAFFEYSKGGRL